MKTYTATIARLATLGISASDIDALFRISSTLSRWFELECGDSNENASWAIERDPDTDAPYRVMHWYRPAQTTRIAIADREKGARRRLEAIMANYPTLTAYIQTDPRGCALYILSPEDLAGHDIEQVYNRGVAVCK